MGRLLVMPRVLTAESGTARDRIVSVRLSEDEYQHLLNLAHDLACSPSEMFRRLLKHSGPRAEQEKRAS